LWTIHSAPSPSLGAKDVAAPRGPAVTGRTARVYDRMGCDRDFVERISGKGQNMFRTSAHAKPVEMMEGITRRTLTFGERMLLVEFTIQAGAVFPEHRHPYEQTGYLCRGAGRMRIGKEWFELLPGSSWNIPADVTHSAEFSQDSLALDIFSPARQDYLAP